MRKPTSALARARTAGRTLRRRRAALSLAASHPMWTTRYGDYDHLARVKEWSLTGGEDEETANERVPRYPRCRRSAPAPGVRSRRFGLGLGQCRLRQDPCAGAARDPAAARRRRSGENPLHHLHQGRRRQYGEPRVRRRLRDWTALDDAALDKAIAEHRGAARTQACARARARSFSRWRWRRRAG